MMNVCCPTVKDELNPTFQPQNPKPVLSRAPSAARAPPAVSGARVSASVVNNRKGSLLSPAASYLHRLSLAGSRELDQGGADASRLHRACSLPVKYRYHSSLGSSCTLCETRPGIVGNACGLTEFRNTKTLLCSSWEKY